MNNNTERTTKLEFAHLLVLVIKTCPHHSLPQLTNGGKAVEY